MLRVRRRQFCAEGFNGAFLPDDFFQRFRAQKFHDGLREFDGFEFFKLFALFGFVRSFGIWLFVAQNLQPQILDVLLVVVLKFFGNFAVDTVFNVAAGDNIGEEFGNSGDFGGNFGFGRNGTDSRIFLQNSAQGNDSFARVAGTQISQRVHFTGLKNEALGTHGVADDSIKGGYFAVDVGRVMRLSGESFFAGKSTFERAEKFFEHSQSRLDDDDFNFGGSFGVELDNGVVGADAGDFALNCDFAFVDVDVAFGFEGFGNVGAAD